MGILHALSWQGYALVWLDPLLLTMIVTPFLFVVVFRPSAKALRKTKEHYQRIIEDSDDLVTAVDPEGALIYVNKNAQEVFGLSPEECVGRSAFDFIHPDDRQKKQEDFANLSERKLPSATIANRQVSRSGKVRNMLWTSTFHYDDNDELTSITSIGRDVTDSTRMEATLRQERERLSALLSNTADLVAAMDEDYTILFMSSELVKEFGERTGKKCY